MMVATLTGLVGVSGVYDAPPPAAVSPYVVVGGDVVTDWSTKTGIGHEHRIAINVWEAGPGTARAKAVMAGVETAMRGLSGSRDGHAVVLVQLVRTLVLSDAEDWTQGILEFRVRTIEI
jgi:hypothetical protein